VSKEDFVREYTRALDNGHSQAGAIAHATEGGCRVAPEPVEAKTPRPVGDIAARIASEENERGHMLSGDDVRRIAARFHNAVVCEYGTASYASGRLR
jgi:hypothetical protein